MESTESRFAHLLQPIRELTKNWEIDVASELNDYLEELDDMCITFDGGKTRLNFAEAALLIQGSTCIYSKKVELLHSLVYQTLDYINDRNRKRNKQSATSPGDGAAGGQDGEDEVEFSPLDVDVSSSQKNYSNTVVDVSPIPPESLIPLEASEKTRLPLISVTGDVVFSQKDFKINLFVPGDKDLILLTAGPAASRFLLVADLPPESQQQRDPGAPVDVAAAEDAGGETGEDFLPVEDHMELDQVQDPGEHVERHQGPSDGRTLRERRLVDAVKATRTETVNVWTLHDPYAVPGDLRPFKPGKCYKVPEGLDDGGKRKRKRAASLLDFRTWFRGTFDRPEQKLKNGPAFPDLNYIYLSTMKDRLRTQRRIYRKAGVMISDDELRRTFLQLEGAGPQQQGEEPVEGFRIADLLGGDGGGGDSDNDQEVFPDEFVELDATSPDARDKLSYEDLVKLRVEQLVVNCRGYTQETALSRRVKDWEDKIRPELVLQEQRTVLDIHDYGGRIIAALSAVGRRRSFASIVAGLDNFEACKYMLASLQLANDYTVEVDEDEGGGVEDRLDSMGLTLLSTQQATDRFNTLTAST